MYVYKTSDLHKATDNIVQFHDMITIMFTPNINKM